MANRTKDYIRRVIDRLEDSGFLVHEYERVNSHYHLQIEESATGHKAKMSISSSPSDANGHKYAPATARRAIQAACKCSK